MTVEKILDLIDDAIDYYDKHLKYLKKSNDERAYYFVEGKLSAYREMLQDIYDESEVEDE